MNASAWGDSNNIIRDSPYFTNRQTKGKLHLEAISRDCAESLLRLI
jgi:hypothetical protein